jgi:hypothetical protein
VYLEPLAQIRPLVSINGECFILRESDVFTTRPKRETSVSLTCNMCYASYHTKIILALASAHLSGDFRLDEGGS